jgi:hypothetical protein
MLCQPGNTWFELVIMSGDKYWIVGLAGNRGYVLDAFDELNFAGTKNVNEFMNTRLGNSTMWFQIHPSLKFHLRSGLPYKVDKGYLFVEVVLQGKASMKFDGTNQLNIFRENDPQQFGLM